MDETYRVAGFLFIMQLQYPQKGSYPLNVILFCCVTTRNVDVFFGDLIW